MNEKTRKILGTIILVVAIFIIIDLFTTISRNTTYEYTADINTQIGNYKSKTTCKYEYQIVDNEIIYNVNCK